MKKSAPCGARWCECYGGRSILSDHMTKQRCLTGGYLTRWRRRWGGRIVPRRWRGLPSRGGGFAVGSLGSLVPCSCLLVVRSQILGTLFHQRVTGRGGVDRVGGHTRHWKRGGGEEEKRHHSLGSTSMETPAELKNVTTALARWLSSPLPDLAVPERPAVKRGYHYHRYILVRRGGGWLLPRFNLERSGHCSLLLGRGTAGWPK